MLIYANYLVEAIKLLQPVPGGAARKILRKLKKMPPSNQITATENTLDSISPLIDRLMRIEPVEEINSIQFNSIQFYITYTKRRQTTTRPEFKFRKFY